MLDNSQTAPKIKILMIDDDIKLCRLVGEYLEPRGFAVTTAHRGDAGLERLAAEPFDAVILDVMLPGADGFAVLKEIRRISIVPVLMLTALGDESDRIVGLELGADDYLPKTFSTRELLARLRAVTRRAAISQIKVGAAIAAAPEEIRVGDLKINVSGRTAAVGQTVLTLTALEFDLLVCLARAAGRVLNRDRLLDEIAGRNYDVFDRSIDVHVSSLRRKLGDDPKSPRYIKTVRSVGYVLVPQSV